MGSAAVFVDVGDESSVVEGIRTNGESKRWVFACDFEGAGKGVGEGIGSEVEFIN